MNRETVEKVRQIFETNVSELLFFSVLGVGLLIIPTPQAIGLAILAGIAGFAWSEWNRKHKRNVPHGKPAVPDPATVPQTPSDSTENPALKSGPQTLTEGQIPNPLE